METVTFKQSGTTRLATTNAYDALNRRTQVVSTPLADAAVSFNYQQNPVNQRTAITNADNSRWVYTYDNLGQVVSGKKYWSDGTPVAGQQFEYSFDDIGNRQTMATGGDQYGASLRGAGYTNNALNQLTSRGIPGYVDIMGEATNTATVTVHPVRYEPPILLRLRAAEPTGWPVLHRLHRRFETALCRAQRWTSPLHAPASSTGIGLLRGLPQAKRCDSPRKVPEVGVGQTVFEEPSTGLSHGVNDQPTYRHDEYFRAELTADNTASALWFGVTNLAVINDGTNVDIVASATGNVFVAQSPEVFSYDANGNVTNDGRWTFTWDGENRLVSMVSLTNSPAESKRRLTFGYDYHGRRITKSVETWTGSSWAMTASNKFLYDGWNLLAELNATNNAVIRSCAWGLDLSGSLQGAGGVGGLLAVTDAADGTHFYAFDGNGNVAALVDAGNGATSANYEYGPFGELVRASGLMAADNPFRFSTKYQDDESDLIYYSYRYYSASTGRWLGRDPLEEQGGPAFSTAGMTI